MFLADPRTQCALKIHSECVVGIPDIIPFSNSVRIGGDSAATKDSQ